jgi:hypothetical protein
VGVISERTWEVGAESKTETSPRLQLSLPIRPSLMCYETHINVLHIANPAIIDHLTLDRPTSEAFLSLTQALKPNDSEEIAQH